jgi:hypothetical protein
MKKIAKVAQQVQTVLCDVADQAVQDSGFCERAGSKLGGPVFVQAVVLACLSQPEPTLEDFVQAAADAHVHVSPQAFDQRFSKPAAACLRQVLQRSTAYAVAGDPVAVALLQRFPGGVYGQDSSVILLPDVLADDFPAYQQDGQRAALKIQVRLDLATGNLAGPFPETVPVADQDTAMPEDDIPTGALRLNDLGYFDLEHFRHWGVRGVYWLSRLQPKTGVLYQDERIEADLADWLQRRQEAVVDVAVTLGVKEQLPARLVAWRVPEEVANRRRQRLRKRAQDQGTQPSRTQLALCAWAVFVTNVPAPAPTAAEGTSAAPASISAPTPVASAAELGVLARARWQLELLFKLWKSVGHADESRSGKPWRLVCEVYGKLIAAVLRHWLTVAGCWRRAGRSWWKAAKAVQAHAAGLAVALPCLRQLIGVVEAILRRMECAAKMAKRRKNPATFQLLQDPSLAGVGLA